MYLDGTKGPKEVKDMAEFKEYGTGRIEVAECRNAREFFKMIEDFENDDSHLFIQYTDGTHCFSSSTEGRPKKINVAKAIFENDYVAIHFNGTVIETADSTGYIYVEVA